VQVAFNGFRFSTSVNGPAYTWDNNGNLTNVGRRRDIGGVWRCRATTADRDTRTADANSEAIFTEANTIVNTSAANGTSVPIADIIVYFDVESNSYLARGRFHHYPYALESDPRYANDAKVSANGLPPDKLYQDGFLFGPRGILQQRMNYA
jgi:hypothetical protein